MARRKQKIRYTFDFSPDNLRPMMELKMVIENEDIFEFFSEHELEEEPAFLEKKSNVAIGLTESIPIEKASGTMMTFAHSNETIHKEYTLTYYNPSMKKAEVFVGSVDLQTKDIAQQVIEESTGMASTYKLYSYVVSPLMVEKVDQRILEEILSEREYGTPPNFGGAAAVVVSSGKGEKEKREIVIARESLIETLNRKESLENRIVIEIVAVDSAIKSLNKGKSVKDALKKLGPVSRMRYFTVYEKKKISKKLITELLMKDVKFLKSVKKELSNLSLDGLLSILGFARSTS